MHTNQILPMKSRQVSAVADVARRVSHGSTAFARGLRMTQPQDGAEVVRIATLQPRTPAAAGMEPEDARLTGATRSLFRRVMGLNVMRSAEPRTPVAVAKKAQRLLTANVITQQVA